MRILITGADGFLGRKLTARLMRDGALNGQPISALTLMDQTDPRDPGGPVAVNCIGGDIADPEVAAAVTMDGFDAVYHLAAVVSGAAEADFDLGLQVNMMGTLNLLEGLRAAGTSPILVYASSVAVHGGEAPQIVDDGIELNPQTSYGTQKAIGELLLNDYSRKGFVDGRGLRLPTVTIRPGRANAAASSFISSIFRDTLRGETANCPVPTGASVWHSAPRTVIDNLIHAAGVPAAWFGPNRNVNLPGRTDTIGQMIDAMTRVAGPDAASRISFAADPVVERIVGGWRHHFRPEKALALGFLPDTSFEDSVRWFLEDDHSA